MADDLTLEPSRTAQGAARTFAFAIAAFAWCTLAAQYGLLIAGTLDGIGPWLGTLRFFSFFTILGNLAVALTATRAAGAGERSLRFFARARTQGGVALCITTVCAIYHFVLGSTWAPQGAQKAVDVCLHYVVPVLYVAWWVACVGHGRLAWTDPLRWLAFPAAFLAWTLLRGAGLHEYPYPFLDVGALGMRAVLGNALMIGGLFVAAGSGFVALDRLVLARRRASRSGP